MRAEPRAGSGIKAPLAQRDRHLISIFISLFFFILAAAGALSIPFVLSTWLCIAMADQHRLVPLRMLLLRSSTLDMHDLHTSGPQG